MIETITHFNIAVSGFPFQKITKLSIVHRVNEHAEAVIEGELDSGAAKDYVQRVDESTIEIGRASCRERVCMFV